MPFCIIGKLVLANINLLIILNKCVDLAISAGTFANQGYPEIVDFGVLVKYRRNGIGSKLMDVAEQIASKYSDTGIWEYIMAMAVSKGYM